MSEPSCFRNVSLSRGGYIPPFPPRGGAASHPAVAPGRGRGRPFRGARFFYKLDILIFLQGSERKWPGPKPGKSWQGWPLGQVSNGFADSVQFLLFRGDRGRGRGRVGKRWRKGRRAPPRGHFHHHFGHGGYHGHHPPAYWAPSPPCSCSSCLGHVDSCQAQARGHGHRGGRGGRGGGGGGKMRGGWGSVSGFLKYNPY